MRALTVWQPWASLLAIGDKKNETRGRHTNIRGQVAIHAAKKPLKEIEPLMEPGVLELANKLLAPILDRNGQLPLGCIVGTGNLVDCILIDEEFLKTLSPMERLFGDYTLGRYAWVFRDVKYFKDPILAKGGQGFWNWESGDIDG